MMDERATVMQNNTICIPKKLRQKFNIKPKDKVVVTLKGDFLQIKKYNPVTLSNLAGIGKAAYKSFGGGEAYLKKERKSWKE